MIFNRIGKIMDVFANKKINKARFSIDEIYDDGSS
jgi:hypothetical protein